MARSDLTVPQTYAALRRAVANVIIKGQRAAELAKVRTYHEAGRLISAHVMNHRGRAGYGAQAVARLSADLGIDRSVLQRCVRFALTIPNWATWPNLAWAHYRVLIPIEDDRLRQSLATEADRECWSVHRLEERLRALVPPESPAIELPGNPPKPLTPKRGTPGVCKVIAVTGAPVVDLGFATYRDVEATRFEAGDFVRVDSTGRIIREPDATKADLFTYHAEVLKVVDGDTLWVKVYLEPGRWVKQKLRLRDLDCPELITPQGKAAKRLVDALVAATTAVTICTTKPDKYDRYLADVFLTTPAGEVYLNNELLRHGHAVGKNDYAPTDWEEG